MKKLVFALLATAATIGAAQAQVQSTLAPRAYFGAGVIGYENQFHIPQASNMDSDAWQASGKLFAGIDIDQLWGLEAGWSHFREANVDFTRNGMRHRGEAKGYGAYFAGKATAPLSERIAVYGKLGIAYTKARVSFSDPGLRGGDDNETGAYAGVGVEWKFNPLWSAVAEYERYGKDKDVGAKPDVFTIGARYSF